MRRLAAPLNIRQCPLLHPVPARRKLDHAENKEDFRVTSKALAIAHDERFGG